MEKIDLDFIFPSFFYRDMTNIINYSGQVKEISLQIMLFPLSLTAQEQGVSINNCALAPDPSKPSLKLKPIM
jgi:hypothetical protein